MKLSSNTSRSWEDLVPFCSAASLSFSAAACLSFPLLLAAAAIAGCSFSAILAAFSISCRMVGLKSARFTTLFERIEELEETFEGALLFSEVLCGPAFDNFTANFDSWTHELASLPFDTPCSNSPVVVKWRSSSPDIKISVQTRYKAASKSIGFPSTWTRAPFRTAVMSWGSRGNWRK